MGSDPHPIPHKGAVRVFFGRYDCAIDAKGRLNFPARFREGMGESFVVMEWLDQCLLPCPWPKWNASRSGWARTS